MSLDIHALRVSQRNKEVNQHIDVLEAWVTLLEKEGATQEEKDQVCKMAQHIVDMTFRVKMDYEDLLQSYNKKIE